MGSYWFSASPPKVFGGIDQKAIDVEDVQEQVMAFMESMEPEEEAVTEPMGTIEKATLASMINDCVKGDCAKRLGLGKQMNYSVLAFPVLLLAYIAYKLSASQRRMLTRVKAQEPAKDLPPRLSISSLETLNKIKAGVITNRAEIITTCIKIAEFDGKCDDQQQVEAIKQLAKVKDLSEQNLDALTKALENQSAYVRVEAALVLAQYRQLPELAQEILSEALKYSFANDDTLLLAAEALLKQEKLSDKALATLNEGSLPPSSSVSPLFLSLSNQLAAVLFSHFDADSLRSRNLWILQTVLSLSGEGFYEKDTVLPEQFQIAAINRLSREERLGKSTLGQLMELLSTPNTPPLIQYHALMALKAHKQPFSEQGQTALSELLDNEGLKEEHKLDICQILVEQKKLGSKAEETLRNYLVSSIEASLSLTQQISAAVLSQHLDPSELHNQPLPGILTSQKSSLILKEFALKGLKRQLKLDDNAIEALIAALNDQLQSVSVNAALTLGKHQANLFEQAQGLLSDALINQPLDHERKIEAIKVLINQEKLSEQALSTLKCYLDAQSLESNERREDFLIAAWEKHFTGSPAPFEQCIALIYAKHDQELDETNQLILVDVLKGRLINDPLIQLARQTLRTQSKLHDETMSELQKDSVPKDIQTAILSAHSMNKLMQAEGPGRFNKSRRSSVASSIADTLASNKEGSVTPSNRRNSWAPMSRQHSSHSVQLDTLSK